MPARESRARRQVSTISEDSQHTDVLIVEEYIPEYRRRFFDQLEATLASDSIRLTLGVSTPSEALTRKSGVPYVFRVPMSALAIGGRRLTYKRLSKLPSPSLIVVDQALRHLENYPLLIGQRWGPKVGLWGHGTRQAKPATWLEKAVERRVTRLGHWFFAYTTSSAERVGASGFPRERISVVQNTIDVSELTRLVDRASAEERCALRSELELPTRNVCLYVGSLEPQKRIPFLLEACAIVADRVPDFALIIAGDGTERGFVETALRDRQWLRYVGLVDEEQKARLGALSDVLLMPGSVGLVAVDSFALRTPIVTTTWPYHGPEGEYLEDGVNARISANSLDDFARVVVELLNDRAELERLKAACAVDARRYTLDTMVRNFATGITEALAAPRR